MNKRIGSLAFALVVGTSSVATADIAIPPPAKPVAQPAKPATPVKPATPPVKPADSMPAPHPHGADVATPAPPAPPKLTPAPELTAWLKTAKGTWKCTGTGMDPNTHQQRAMVFTTTWKADLDGFWAMGSLVEKKTKVAPTPMKMTMYRGYDAATKTWISVGLDNMGMVMNGTSKGPQNGVEIFESTFTMAGQKYWMRDKEEMKGPKELAISGEMSMDGKQWMPVYSATCKK